jgi:hypothetical protein
MPLGCKHRSDVKTTRMKTIWAWIGFTVVACTAIVRGQDLSFQVQAGSATDTVSLASGPNDTWTYNSSNTITLGNSEIYTASVPGEGPAGLVINADPSINYGFGVTNTGTTTMKYTFTFPMPTMALAVNLPAGTYAVSASFGDTLTPAPGDTAQFSLASGFSTYQQSFINGTDAGVDIVVPTGPLPSPQGSSLESDTSPSDGTNTEVFSFPNSTGTYTLSSTGTTMSVTTTFDLSAGDSASFSGSFVVVATPEPSSVALSLLAVLGFAGLVIRARRQRL